MRETTIKVDRKRCEILCVGTELLLGDILNTNAQYLAQGLSKLGLDLYVQTVVGDNEARLENAIHLAMTRADILLFTGGLGPTTDDITKEVAARCFHRELYMDEDALREIQDFYALTRRAMPVSNQKQALMPRGGLLLKNPQGTAPGCMMTSDEGHLAFLMPGPPREMRPMFDNEVAPILARYSNGGLYSKAVRVVSLGESRMAEMLQDLIDAGTNPTLAPYAKDGEAMVRVTARASSKEEAKAILDPVINEVLQRLGRHAYGVDVPNLESVISEKLQQQGLTLSFAEAGTGGLAAQRFLSCELAQSVCGPGLSAMTTGQLACALGLMDALPENTAEACALLSQHACKHFGTTAGLCTLVSGQELACAVTVLGETRQYAARMPARGADYYRTQASQAALDMLRLMLMDREA
ncbi:MAG: CinA family nicotinamide mononucleotide deamidase-related protein [Clostridiales bacterium]|jgi:nicotinamide-nucleotide amidase|nr:CinA family nicotinamide mononucleotide deamidase-related protein [Clostridiales bacterium]